MLKLRPLDSVARYSLIGMVTRPNWMAPFHIARATVVDLSFAVDRPRVSGPGSSRPSPYRTGAIGPRPPRRSGRCSDLPEEADDVEDLVDARAARSPGRPTRPVHHSPIRRVTPLASVWPVATLSVEVAGLDSHRRADRDVPGAGPAGDGQVGGDGPGIGRDAPAGDLEPARHAVGELRPLSPRPIRVSSFRRAGTGVPARAAVARHVVARDVEQDVGPQPAGSDDHGRRAPARCRA